MEGDRSNHQDNPRKRNKPKVRVTRQMELMIVNMAVDGIPSAEIARKLYEKTGKMVDSSTVRKIRAKHGEKIATSFEAQVNEALTQEPHAKLVYRVGELSEVVAYEKKRKRRSGMVMVEALKAISHDIHRAASYALRVRELQLKHNESEQQLDRMRILDDVETRITKAVEIMREQEEYERRIEGKNSEAGA